MVAESFGVPVVPPLPASVVEVKVSPTPPMVRVVFTAVELLPLDVCWTVNLSPLTHVPALDVYDPPFLLYVPPEMDTLVVALIPETVMVLLVCTVFRGASVISVKVKASGVVSVVEPPAIVVDVKVSLTPPMVRVVFTAVELLLLDVWRTVKVSPFTHVPALDVYVPPFLLYVPPEIDTLAVPLMPETVMALLVCTVLRAALATSLKVKASGVVSAV